MSTRDDDIEYRGNEDAFKPPVGGFRGSDVLRGPREVTNSYADKSYLQERLDLLNQYLDVVFVEMERELATKAMPITDKDEDEQLREANTAIWPSSLGKPRSYVTYGYYNALKAIDSNASKLIRRRFESAARDVLGDVTFDLLQLVNVMKQEASLIETFILQYVGSVDDSSEKRVLELLQDWVDAAIGYIKVIYGVFQKKSILPSLPKNEVNTLTPEEARQSQAVFKIKLNSANGEIESSLGLYRRHFADYAAVFYNSFLGPALDLRLNVSRKVYPTKGALGDEVWKATAGMNSNLQVLLGDVLRRNKIFDEKTKEILALIKMRETYKGYILQLETVGRKVQGGTSSSLVNNTVDEGDVIKAFSQQTTSSSQFRSSHRDLADSDADDAHPQYLLKDGGHVTGNITVGEDVTIDGVPLAVHDHDGVNSAAIDGRNIKPGTIGIGKIDTSVGPTLPTQLRILASSTKVNSVTGFTSYDVTIGFEGDEDDSFEIQVALVV